MKNQKSKNVAVGRGWVGRWQDGSIGWAMPDWVLTEGISAPRNRGIADSEKLFLCEITVKVIKNKRGRLITRKMSVLRNGYNRKQ